MSVDTICGVVEQPLGCPITLVYQGGTPGETITWGTFDPDAGVDGSFFPTGTSTVDENGDTAITITSLLSSSEIWQARLFGSLGEIELTFHGGGGCFDYVTEPVLDATVVGGDDVELEWTEAEHCDSRYGSIITYEVRRDGDLIVSGLTDLEYTDVDVPVGEYVYQVRAVWDTTFIGGLAANSNGVTVEIETHVRAPILRAVAEPVDIFLSWSVPVSTDPLNTVDGYRIEKRLTAGGSIISTFAGIAPTRRSYRDFGVTAGTTYFYTVVADMAVTGDSRSNQARARIPLSGDPGGDPDDPGEPGEPGGPDDPGFPPYPANPLSIDLGHVRFRLGDTAGDPTEFDGIDLSSIRFRVGTPTDPPPAAGNGSIGLDNVRYRPGE